KKSNPQSDSIAERRPLLQKGASAVICVLFFVVMLVFFLQSAFDTDKTVSESENRTLAQMPKMTWQTVTDGTFAKDFDTYYADTFPERERFLSINQKISAFFSGTRSANDVVLVEKGDKDDFAGQDMDYEEETF
ncbi:MAG: DHHW family protein, partial [Candidatus Fimenecus sp.]